MNSQLVWIHCNKCYEIFVHKKSTFFLLSCSHIFCQSCLAKCATENDQRHCSLCKRTIASKQICSEMSPKYKRFFNPNPPQNMIDFEVLSFQVLQFKNLIKALYRGEQYFEKMKNEIEQMLTETTEMNKACQELKQQAAKWDAKLLQIKDVGEMGEEYTKFSYT